MATDDEATKKPIYPRELLERIRALQDMGFDLSALSSQYSMGEDDLSKLVTQMTTAGRLTILLKPEREVQDARAWTYLGDLEGKEWIALFRDVLNCPVGLDEPYTSGENLDERYERARIRFQQAIPDYPMLGRIWDKYIDIVYKPEEIDRLRCECLRVRASTSNEQALAGLAKLLSACDEASKLNSGLLLACE